MLLVLRLTWKVDNGDQVSSMYFIDTLLPSGQTKEYAHTFPLLSDFHGRWQEEIRLVVDTFASTLLPAHFDAISTCWNESLSKAPVVERVKLVSFLIQLHSHFPSWKGSMNLIIP